MIAIGNKVHLGRIKMFHEFCRCLSRRHAILSGNKNLYRAMNRSCCRLAVLIVVAGLQIDRKFLR